MPPPSRHRPVGATLDNLIYTVGGSTKNIICHDTALGTVQVYDPLTNAWSDKAPLQTPRLQIGLGADGVHHLLYAIGGTTAAPNYAALDTVEVYNPATDSWTIKQHLNTPRGLPAVAAVNGKIYAIGGQAQDHGLIATVEEFDPDANGGFGAWTTKNSLMPHPRQDPASAIVGGKVYIMGGTNEGIISTVDVYDPTSDTWTTVAPLLTARKLLGAAVVDNTIYAVGGAALVARVGEQFTYQITATNNPTSYDAAPLPPGLSIDRERGIISGIPTSPAQGFVVTFTATNPDGADSRDVSFYIVEPSPPLSQLANIVSTTCVTGRAGQPFSFQVLTNNATSETRISATGLPYSAGLGPELTIDPGTGLIFGQVPSTADTSAESFGAGIKLTDGDATQSYLQLTFVSDPLFPVITSGSNAALIPNKFFSYTITADAPTDSLDYLGLDGALNGALPAGLSFDPTTGTISGIYTGSAAPDGPAQSVHEPQDVDGGTWIDTIKKEPPPRIQLLALKGNTGTGTAPLNFMVGLHDLEAEALTSMKSDGTDYVIFTDDPLTSGGAAGLLEATKAGDFVSYTFPPVKRGFYDVKLGVRTGSNQGTVQLSVDGANQGLPQDTYSPAVGYDIRDLGVVRFSESEAKTFQFSVTNRNPGSSGYQFICDYLDLVPHFEAEHLSVKAHSAPIGIIHDKDLSGTSARVLKATRLGDFITYGVPVAEPGVYNIKARASTGSNTGMSQLFVEGLKQGYVQKAGPVESSSGYSVRDLGTVTFVNAGEKAFQFRVTGRNLTGPKCSLALDYLELVLASHLEAEALTADSTTELVQIADDNLAGQAGMLLDAHAPGNSVSYHLKVPSAGSYQIKVGIRKGHHSGIVQLAIDGVNQGPVCDDYSAKVDYEVMDLGRVSFTEAGDRTFQFLVTGRNPNSKGYQFVLDYIDLVR
jgi:hypothetical protein